MKSLPHGWSDSYTIRYLFDQVEQMREQIASLNSEIARLDVEKQGRRGPKPKPTAQGDARQEITL